MSVLHIMTTVLILLLTGAHYLRSGEASMAFLFAALSFLLILRRKWAHLVLAAVAALTIPVWIHAGLGIILIRRMTAEPWLLAVLIISLVAVIALTASVLGFRRVFLSVKSGYEIEMPSLAAFMLTGGILLLARGKASLVILLPDRFVPGSGMVLIVILAAYAAWLTEKYISTEDTSSLRLRIWLAFSIVFFGQALLGTGGLGKFLMTGQLHVPVPAVIIGGPIYRGGGLFMVVLFASTLVLTGSAWCSHFCYFGAWDNLAAGSKNRAGTVTPVMKAGRWIFLVLIVVVSMVLKYTGVSSIIAAGAGLFFGVTGAAVMVFLSRRRGVMGHCTAWCPLGLIADLGGKISPFRIRISDRCTACMACTSICRYGALDRSSIMAQKPGIACSLCGDCLPVCKEGALAYSFMKLSADKSRVLFIVMTVSLHASFLGLARI